MGVKTQIPVLWGDMDALGHVNNTRFFVWFESARIAYFHKIGMRVDDEVVEGPILASTQCNFRMPVEYPGEIEVETSVTKIGNTSFVMDFQARNRTKGDQEVANGSCVVVLVNYKSGEKIQVSEKMRAAIERVNAEG